MVPSQLPINESFSTIADGMSRCDTVSRDAMSNPMKWLCPKPKSGREELLFGVDSILSARRLKGR
jgi:hypothetical protein